MMRFPLPVLALAACLLLPASALELSDLRLPLTRDEADKVLSRDYSFRVLQDMTVRRSWELKGGRTVSVDFAPGEGDKALLIFVDYARPVTKFTCDEDATQILGMEPAKWQPVNSKRAMRLGMEAAEGFKLSGDRYCFRELDEQGRVLRLAYYAGQPSREVRWELADDVRHSGKTAMGSRSSGGASDFLWIDEERRRGVSAHSSASSLASAAAAVVADAPDGPSTMKPKMLPRPEEPEDALTKVLNWAASLSPIHYAIAGGVLLLMMFWSFLGRRREAKRRALVQEIMRSNKGRKQGGKPGACGGS